MTNQRTPIDGGLGLEHEKNRQRLVLESAAKFRFFFAALVFAILSFAIQFPIRSTGISLKCVEASSWGLIAITALLALADIGGFSLSSEPKSSLTKFARGTMWVCFLVGVMLLLVSKIWAAFQN